MRKKKSKTKPKKPKIDVVLESLLNLETVVRELIQEVNQLKNKNTYYPHLSPMPTNPEPKYWPNTNEPPYKYKDSTWDAINNGWQ